MKRVRQPRLQVGDEITLLLAVPPTSSRRTAKLKVVMVRPTEFEARRVQEALVVVPYYGMLQLKDEGVVWCRGWYGAAVSALKAVGSL